jgi:DNA-binding NtrC family response regulator
LAKNEDWEKDVSTVGLPSGRMTPRPRMLRLVGDSFVSTHPLPSEGALRIGRSAEADLRVQDPSVSRLHAIIHLGSPIRIEDLGSANGTRLGARVLRPNEPVEVMPGQLIEIGSVSAIVQIGTTPGGAPTANDEALGPALAGSPRSVGIVVADESMRAVYRVVDRIARGAINVLVLGETGVGKEVIAQAIHDRSPRAARPFLRLNCGALPEQLAESELFGHEKGAFTGADRPKVGLLEAASGGTIFFDEVGELPLALQVKLLRVIEERQVLRLGAVQPRAVDVRFIAATNRDLELDVARGRFREDLLFRLDGISISVPPLRERVAEIAELAELFAAQSSANAGRETVPRWSEEALQRLRAHRWPGNVRELRNAVDRAVLLCEGETIHADDLKIRSGRATHNDWPRAQDAPPQEPPPREGGLSREAILDALERCAGNQTRAAKFLGVSRSTFVARLDVLGIRRPRRSG